jgi:hypothetical protein
MSDDRFMRELGRVVREERAASDEAGGALAQPFTRAELDAMIGKTATALADAKAKDSRVVPLTPRRGGTWFAAGAVAAALALAAAIVLWMQSPGNDPALLAHYELVVQGTARDVRGETNAPSSGPVLLARDGLLTITLRPSTPSRAPVDARAFVARGDELRPLAIAPERSAEGALRVKLGPESIAELPDGPSRLIFFVGAPSHVPGNAVDAKARMAGPQEGVQAISLDVSVR